MNRAPTLGEIVRAYKAVSTRRVRQTVSAFAWQRKYYEHVIRDEQSFHRIQQYIMHNPVRWSVDPENPHARTAERRMRGIRADEEIAGDPRERIIKMVEFQIGDP